MANYKNCRVWEIERGPHFLTIYGKEREDLYALAKVVREKFIEKRPELECIQQPDFLHEKHDPRVYHPYGHPASGGTRPGRPQHRVPDHFHIRYAYRPTQDDINEVIDICLELRVPMAGVLQTELEDQMCLKWEYPEVPKDHEEYLEWIQDIKDNKYKSVVE